MPSQNVISISRPRESKEYERHLTFETVEVALNYFCEEFGVKFKKAAHRNLFLDRKYRCMKDIAVAVKRYKVFGDLGY